MAKRTTNSLPRSSLLIISSFSLGDLNVQLHFLLDLLFKQALRIPSKQPQQQVPPQQQQQQQQQQAPNMMGGEYQQQFQQMNAMAPMAMNMGQQFLGAQTEMLKQKADQYIPTTKLRYLFAVDNSYVFQKLKIITLPWLHSDWMLKYQTDVNNPVAPRYVLFLYF